jgi:XTP/dITP diphosphohydrolase
VTPLVLATRNEGKLRELRPLFSAAGIAVVDLRAAGLGEELPEEDALEAWPTFAENALAKARYFSQRLGGRACVADDSGLEVAALGGRPGVRSRRWSADEGFVGADLDGSNNALLLRALAEGADRTARFVCAAAYVSAERECLALGEVSGSVTLAARGTHGFGYDPLFYVTELGRTLAEATVEEKERVSHRGRAFRALLAQLGAGN